MIRIHLSDDQRSELQPLRQTPLPAVARTQLEMVFLSAASWPAPKIAQHLGDHPHTARSARKGFRDGGAEALQPDTPGPDPDHDRRATVTGKLSERLGQERTWTARPLADALGPDIGIGHRQTRRYLADLKAGYRRTAQTVGHKQDPNNVARAERVLGSLNKSCGGPVEAVVPGPARVPSVAADRVLVVLAQVADQR